MIPLSTFSMRPYVIFGWMVLCLVATTALAAPSNAPNSTFAGFVDKSGELTIDDVREQADWDSFTDWKGWGYGTEPLWLRVNVPASPQTDEPPHILIVRPP
jgi:hypothetical protein